MPERFVDAWAEIQSMPIQDKEDPNRFAYYQLQQEAMQIIESALRSAVRISDQVKRLKKDIDKARAGGGA
jgi:hypothetical protein